MQRRSNNSASGMCRLCPVGLFSAPLGWDLATRGVGYEEWTLGAGTRPKGSKLPTSQYRARIARSDGNSLQRAALRHHPQRAHEKVVGLRESARRRGRSSLAAKNETTLVCGEPVSADQLPLRRDAVAGATGPRGRVLQVICWSLDSCGKLRRSAPSTSIRTH